MYSVFKRILDLFLCFVCLFFFFIPIVFLLILVRVSSKGPVIYWSDRVGRFNRIFSMPKLRTMRVNTPELATDALSNSESYLTPMGGLLRKLSLDELPQLYSVARGDMSFVGPRPALYNQHDLIDRRENFNVDSLLPGITGWAQVNGRDSISLKKKVELDTFYLNQQCLALDIKILVLTVVKVFCRDDISH